MRAAIDIGTNTVLLLVAKINEGKIHTLYEAQRIPRLGKGVDSNRNINDEAASRVIEALTDYKQILESSYPEVKDVIVTATSAVRDASNRDEFLRKIKSETGFDVRLLSGDEEAEWTAAGALSALNNTRPSLIIDIGGGSTELVLCENGEISDSYSFDIGSVRFTERFLKSEMPAQEEIERCRKEIRRELSQRLFSVGENVQAVGVAGTLTTLAGLALDLRNYQPEQINGYYLNMREVAEFVDVFSRNHHSQLLKKNPVLLEGRSDIFLAGLLILQGFMEVYSFDEVTVSTGGIRHGALIKTS